MAAPASGAIATTNIVANKTGVTQSQHANNTDITAYPATNAVLPERTKRWRQTWTGTSNDTVTVVVDCLTAVTPTVFALVDLSATAGSVKFTGADNADLSTNANEYSQTLYDASDSGVHIFYPTVSNARRYWAFNIANGVTLSSSGYVELGALWIGTKIDVRPASGAGVNIVDPSVRTVSYGGAIYDDQMPVHRKMEWEMTGLSQAESGTLQSTLRGAAHSSVVVDLHSNSSSVPMRNAGLAYGRITPEGIATSLVNGSDNGVRVQLVENRR